MNWLDVGILIIVGLFVLVGVLRGFIAELLSFLAWVVSFLVAWFFSGDFTGWFAGHVQDANIQSVLVFLILFLVTFVAMAVAGHFVRILWLKNSSKAADSVLGGLMGFLKGSAVIVVVVLLAGLTPFPTDSTWHASVLVGYFQGAALYVAHWLPADVAHSLRYS
ncbi:MAG TPA: CvpA family protein [Acidiferrobacter sp.]|nr:CvpA family protein [Acidiferrobacter sp.]